MSEKRCPKCGRINPRQQLVCKCGYNFRTQSVDEPSFIHTKLLTTVRRVLRSLGCIVGICALLLGIALGGFYRSCGRPEDAVEPNIFIVVGLILMIVAIVPWSKILKNRKRNP